MNAPLLTSTSILAAGPVPPLSLNFLRAQIRLDAEFGHEDGGRLRGLTSDRQWPSASGRPALIMPARVESGGGSTSCKDRLRVSPRMRSSSAGVRTSGPDSS